MLLSDIFEINLDGHNNMTESYCYEMFDHDPTIAIEWKQELLENYPTQCGYFSVKNYTYRIIIQSSSFPNPIIPHNKYINIGFQIYDNSNHLWSNLAVDGSQPNQPFAVIGTVTHGISQRIIELYSNIDAIIFGMTTHVEKRGKIYSYAANKILKEWPGTKLFNGIKTKNGIVSIIFTPHNDEHKISEFIQYIELLTLNK